MRSPYVMFSTAVVSCVLQVMSVQLVSPKDVSPPGEAATPTSLYGRISGYCTDPDTLINCAGNLSSPLTYIISRPVAVYHDVQRDNPLYRKNLWLYPAENENDSDLFYTPGRVIEFGDVAEAAQYLGLPFHCPIWYPQKKELMKNITERLKDKFDTLKFSQHLDFQLSMTCGTGCCSAHDTRQCDDLNITVPDLGIVDIIRKMGYEKPPGSMLFKEWIALHSWSPYECPGHPQLSSRSGKKCACKHGNASVC
eukprot:gnl/TRDRNA2_/TRDRNA2_192838_c0_seq1.p1 gnl/TRDRNA2_/TRDRNA2_192838_c0~~gnl/TRDRNA2_/TRDRNA2_192838_c0_seq1.p1  ORF type:complete len:252 (+),score=19.79 gnl/TRDRNA2_/TRDRNA2_192838_c0_seq1:88-843(+)